MTRTSFLALMIFQFAIWPSTSTAQPQFEADQTSNKRTAAVSQFIRQAMDSLSLEKDTARFQTREDGPKFCLGVPGPQNMRFVSKFFVKKGDKFFSPDRHGSQIFSVKEIDSEKLILEYVSKFDGRSIGGGMTDDSGEITLEPFVEDAD